MGGNSTGEITGLGEDCPYAAAAVFDYLTENKLLGNPEFARIRRRASAVLRKHPEVLELLNNPPPNKVKVKMRDGTKKEIDISGTFDESSDCF